MGQRREVIVHRKIASRENIGESIESEETLDGKQAVRKYRPALSSGTIYITREERENQYQNGTGAAEGEDSGALPQGVGNQVASALQDVVDPGQEVSTNQVESWKASTGTVSRHYAAPKSCIVAGAPASRIVAGAPGRKIKVSTSSGALRRDNNGRLAVSDDYAEGYDMGVKKGL
jgi:hypothetical protein